MDKFIDLPSPERIGKDYAADIDAEILRPMKNWIASPLLRSFRVNRELPKAEFERLLPTPRRVEIWIGTTRLKDVGRDFVDDLDRWHEAEVVRAVQRAMAARGAGRGRARDLVEGRLGMRPVREELKKLKSDFRSPAPGRRGAPWGSNLDLLKSVPATYLDDLGKRYDALEARGAPTADWLSRFLFDDGPADERVRLIGRDQTTRLTGELTRVRMRALGVTGYVWQSPPDAKVRGDHPERNGKSFNWQPRAFRAIPGAEADCRCLARSVIPPDWMKQWQPKPESPR